VAEKDPRRYDLSAGIHPSARKHGIADDDIHHAIKHAMTIKRLDIRKRLYLGPARNAELLEVISLVRDEGGATVIHAMKIRPRFQRMLPGG
jgi:hypothetical protein